MDEFFAIARLNGCFGIKGYVKVQMLTHSPERFLKLKNVFLGLTVANLKEQTLEDVIFQQRSTIVKFEGIDDRTAAERFVGQYIFVPGANVVKPPKGSYFVHDLIGCEVWTEEGQLLGTIEDVVKTPSSDLWTIRNGTLTNMIPAVKEFVVSVDIPNRKVVVRTIEGLLEE